MSNETTPPPALSTEEAKTVTRLFRESLRSGLRPDEAFTLQGEWAEGHLCLTLELSAPARDQVLRLECAYAMEVRTEEATAKARGLLVEFLHETLDQWLENDRFPSPELEWRTHEFAGEDILLRGSFRNEKLEKLADQWLEAAERGESPPDVEGA